MTTFNEESLPDIRPMILKLAEQRAGMAAKNKFAPYASLGRPRKGEKHYKDVLAQDSAFQNVLARSIGNQMQFSAFPMFLGYGMLSNLAQEALIRAGVETIADDMTRKPPELYYDDDGEDKEDLINQVNSDMAKFKIKARINEAMQKDGYFGGCLGYIDVGDLEDDEAEEPLVLEKETFKKGSFRGIKIIEPVNIAPGDYNTTNPTDEHYFNPEWYYVLGKRYHASRFLYFAGNETPLLLKPAYNFFGIPQAQIVLDYVANFVRNRESGQELLNKFSLTCFGTDLSQALQQDGSWADIINRMKAFNKFKTNNGTFVYNKETEEMTQINTPLSGVRDIIEMSMNCLTAVWRIPKVRYLGEGDGGLNASTDGQLRSYYDYIYAMQEKELTTPYDTIIKILQLNRGLEPDEKLLFKFPYLWEMDEKERAELNKIQAERDAVYLSNGVVSQEECRRRLSLDRYSGFTDIDVDDVPEPQEQPLANTDKEEQDEEDRQAMDMAMDGRWITIGAREKGENGEDDEGRKGRHIYLDDGETPEEAVEELKKDDKKYKKPEEKKDESEQKEPNKKSDASNMTDEEIAQRHAEYSKKAMELLRKGREAKKDSEEYKDIQKQLKELQDEYDDVLTEREKRANKNNVFVNTRGQEKETTKEKSSKESSDNRKMKESVKSWYKKSFEDDSLGDRIDESVTFEDIKQNPQKVYDLIGVNDSLVRERIFIEISDRQNKDYDEIYQSWLGNKEGSKKESSFSSHIKEAKTIDEASEMAKVFVRDGGKVHFSKRTRIENANEMNKTIARLADKYKMNYKYQDYGDNPHGSRYYAHASASTMEGNVGTLMSLDKDGLEGIYKKNSKNWVSDRKENLAMLTKRYQNATDDWDKTYLSKRMKDTTNELKYERFTVFKEDGNVIESIFTHEYGHTIYFDRMEKEIEDSGFEEWNSFGHIRKHYNKTKLETKAYTLTRKAFIEAKKTGDIYKISNYANANQEEFFAECFAMRELGQKVPEYIDKMLTEVIGK